MLSDNWTTAGCCQKTCRQTLRQRCMGCLLTIAARTLYRMVSILQTLARAIQPPNTKGRGINAHATPLSG